MKIQLLSDLHADVAPVKPITVAPDIDVVIVAGDTCQGAECGFAFLRRIVPMQIPVVAVLGNHEYYGRCLPDELAHARAVAPLYGVHLLENDAVVIDGVRFVGATLWTDYALFGEARLPLAMSAARAGLNDHHRITWAKEAAVATLPAAGSAAHAPALGCVHRSGAGEAVCRADGGGHPPRPASGLGAPALRGRHVVGGVRLRPLRGHRGRAAVVLGARSRPHLLRLPRRRDPGAQQPARLRRREPGLRAAPGGGGRTMITPLRLDPNLVRALGPDVCTPEVTGRLRRLADDLDRIAAGTAPTQMDLKTAPLLVDWQLTTRLTGICLAGFVAGHPLLDNRRIVTSHVWALDPGYRWARTLSRFYKLGLPQGGGITGPAIKPHGLRHGGQR